MSDRRLRAAARDAQLAPTPESEARLLRERLRAGSIDPARLELAAYCGHQGALELVEAPCPCGMTREVHPTEDCGYVPDLFNRRCAAFDGPECAGCDSCALWRSVGLDAPDVAHQLWTDWFDGLLRWGRHTSGRAAVAMLRHVLPAYERQAGEVCCCGSCLGACGDHGFVHACDYHQVKCQCAPVPHYRARRTIDAIEAWVHHQTEVEAHRDAVRSSYTATPLSVWLAAVWVIQGGVDNLAAAVMEAARVTSYDDVRNAVQRYMIAFALREE